MLHKARLLPPGRRSSKTGDGARGTLHVVSS
jgi:hypothetical protein